jgi:bifunctional enzyme CysN/CysC
VRRGDNMPWFQGSPLLDHLETVHVAGDRNLVDLRFPVQLVVRPDSAFRGYAGTVASGVVRIGDRIAVLPSGKQSSVASIVTFDGEVQEAFAGLAVTLTLRDEIDVSRGDMIVAPNNAPPLANTIEAMVVWFADAPLRTGASYLLKQTTAQTAATVDDIRYRINVGTLHREPAPALVMNEVGRIRLECARPLAADAYGKNRGTGAFILIDRLSNATVGAGMIVERKTAADAAQRRRSATDAGSNVRLQTRRQVAPEERKARLGQEPFVLWITGLPRAGKSSLAYGLEKWLFDHQHHVHVLDGEILRLGINNDLGFSGADRWENQRRAAELARLNLGFGISTIVALVSPLGFERERAREIVGNQHFFELWCDAPIEACEARDEDGLFARARAGEIFGVTGVDAPYERPAAADLVLDTVADSQTANVQKVVDFLQRRGLLR